MSGQLLPGYVLHQRPFRDQSLLIELFTPDCGRQGAIARRSRRRVLQPFQPLWLDLGGRGELRTVRGWEPRGQPLWLHGNALLSGLYINELLYRLLHRDEPQPELFADYELALGQLAQRGTLPADRAEIDKATGSADSNANLEWTLRRFELRLLEVLGYALDLTSDAYGQPLSADGYYRFEAGTGLVPDTADESWAGRDLIDYRSGRHSAAARRAIKGLCRSALAPHLGARPLLSRQLFPRGG